MKRGLAVFAGLVLFAQGEEKKVVQGHVFAWPFTEVEKMQPRGGSSKGTKVTLDGNASAHWKKLQSADLGDLERDHQAILAMTGSHRVSFDFIETMGFAEGYRPPKPYFSWGTEHVQVIKQEEKFISLQHTLVMYFKDKDEKESGPMVMKHWRQDWTYEDTDMHTYRGENTWARKKRSPKSVKGAWSQAVYQVDDSPRYEVIGKWSHQGGMSVWTSESSWRPLPRREFSVRDDYNVLECVHEITVNPTGWVHLQNNRKLIARDGKLSKYVGQELGVNRYERITAPSLMAAEETLKKTGAYWAEVREMWNEVSRTKDRFGLKSKVDDKKLYALHFGYAAQVEAGEYDAEAGRKHARETVSKFLTEGKPKKEGKY